VHNQPHGHVAWSEFQYVIDDYGGNALMHGKMYNRALAALFQLS
jgi:hypothetical protein